MVLNTEVADLLEFSNVVISVWRMINRSALLLAYMHAARLKHQAIRDFVDETFSAFNVTIILPFSGCYV